MRHNVALARLAGRPKVPFRSWIIVTLALAAFAITLAWLADGGQAEAAPAAYHAPAAAAAPAAVPEPPDKARLARVAHGAVVRQAAAILAAHTYTVRSGDSLSTVAARRCGQARFWTGIYAASRAHGWTAKNANVLSKGQHLYLSCTYDARSLRFAPAPPPPPVLAVAAVATARTGGSARTYHRVASSSSSSGYGNVNPGSYGGYRQCVISRESGGQSQVMNGSGHYGLYQFDYGTWVSGGGSGGSFGHASVSEQNRVFAAVYAARGTQPWTPSDGC